MTRLYPAISDTLLLQKVLEYSMGRRPKSWAGYVAQATNKIAGVADLDEDMTRNAEVDNEGEENIAMHTPSSEPEDIKKPTVENILINANRVGTTSCGAVWVQQFKN